MNQKELFFSKYRLVSSLNIPTILGFGAHSSVQLATNSKTHKYVAVKKIHKKLALKQSLIHSTLLHTNIVSLIEPFHDFETESTFLVLQYVSNGTLHDLIATNICLSVIQICRILKGLCEGLMEIHKNYVIHRDIKVTAHIIQPSNVMLDENLRPKICDFGSATFQRPNLNQVCGTFQYLAPQILTQKPYSNKVDIWALGISFYELIEGKMPFEGQELTERLKQMQKPLKYTKQKWSNLIHLIKKMLNFNPDYRPTPIEIIKFINKFETYYLRPNYKVENSKLQSKIETKTNGGRQDSQNSTFDEINENGLLSKQKQKNDVKNSRTQQKLTFQKKEMNKISCQKGDNLRRSVSPTLELVIPENKCGRPSRLLKKSKNPKKLSIKLFLEQRKAEVLSPRFKI